MFLYVMIENEQFSSHVNDENQSLVKKCVLQYELHTIVINSIYNIFLTVFIKTVDQFGYVNPSTNSNRRNQSARSQDLQNNIYNDEYIKKKKTSKKKQNTVLANERAWVKRFISVIPKKKLTITDDHLTETIQRVSKKKLCEAITQLSQFQKQVLIHLVDSECGV